MQNIKNKDFELIKNLLDDYAEMVFNDVHDYDRKTPINLKKALKIFKNIKEEVNFQDPWESYPILKDNDRVVIQNENYSDLYQVIIEKYYSLSEIHLEKAEVRNRIAKLVKVKGN